MATSLCADDEYFDVVVQQCNSCHDVCQPHIHRQQRDFCLINCPQYYREHFDGRAIVSVATTTSAGQATDHHHHNVMSLEYRLVSEPLFWTSVVSMLLAVVCTIAIVVLCLTSRRARTTCYQRAVRVNLSAAPSAGELKKLHLDDDYYKQLRSTHISLGPDNIELRSTSSQTVDYDEATRYIADCSAGDVERRQWTLMHSAAAQQHTSYTSETTWSSWFHRRQQQLSSRLHNIDSARPPDYPAHTHRHQQRGGADDGWVVDAKCSSGCQLSCPGCREQYNADETSPKLLSSTRNQRQQLLSTVVTLSSFLQPLQHSGCAAEDDVMTVCDMSTMHHKHLTTSLGYCSRIH